jgi:hypothetical protein
VPYDGQNLIPGTSSTLGEAQMSVRIPTTLALAVTAVTATTANAESGHPRNSYHCINNTQIIDLNSVSDIAQKVVGEEPISHRQASCRLASASWIWVHCMKG